MKRKLFFWLEKLKISRAERHAISLLMSVLVLLFVLNALLSPSSPFGREYYTEVDRAFRLQTMKLHQKEKELLARYDPGATVETTQDTIPSADSSAHPLVDINSADAKTLQKLPGIGAAYAQHIIEYRRVNGPFLSKDELLKVKGIGSVRLARLRSLIVVGAAVESPVLKDTVAQVRVMKGKPEEAVAGNLININTADTRMLQKLPGIGPAYAQRIVEYRSKNGSFTTKDELLKIKGIGKKRLAKIKPFIKLTEQ